VSFVACLWIFSPIPRVSGFSAGNSQEVYWSEFRFAGKSTCLFFSLYCL